MIIKIMNSKGAVKKININKNDTILKVKQIFGNIEAKLKFDGEVLQDNNTISYYGIEENDILHAEYRSCGVGGINTVDITKNITNEVEGAKDGPSYREGCKGLCIRSICKNKNCVAYNDTIYIKIGI